MIGGSANHLIIPLNNCSHHDCPGAERSLAQAKVAVRGGRAPRCPANSLHPWL